MYSTNTPTCPDPTTRSRNRRWWFSKFPTIQTPPWMNSRTPGGPLVCSGFMMVRFTLRPATVMVRVLVVTPDMSTGVCDWSPVRISCGFGCGSCQNGLLSLLILARNDRTCGSIRRSVAGVQARLRQSGS